MALITCPECGKRVSNKAEVCPNCGFPLSGYQTPPSEDVRIVYVCPDCKTEMKNACDNCPKCGCPSTLFIKKDVQIKQPRNSNKTLFTVIISLIAVGALAVAFWGLGLKEKLRAISSYAPPTFTQEVFKSNNGFAIFKSNDTEVTTVVGTMTIGNYFIILYPQSEAPSFGRAIFLISNDLSGKTLYDGDYSYHIDENNNTISFYSGIFYGQNVSGWNYNRTNLNSTIAQIHNVSEDPTPTFTVHGISNRNHTHTFCYYNIDNRSSSFKSSILSYPNRLKR